MCGRFVLTLPSDAVAQIFAAAPDNDLPRTPDYNVCPTNAVHVVTAGDGGRHLSAMRWGFVPHWYKTLSDGPLLINARSETVAEKPAFRSACRERRCILPATGFYEWTKGDGGARLPWYIHPGDDAPVAFAGIWQSWRPKDGGDAIDTCAIVTTSANRAMSAIHHRMPVSLAPADWPLWLGEDGKGAAALMRPAPEDLFAWHRVDPAVNSNRASGAQLIAPVAA